MVHVFTPNDCKKIDKKVDALRKNEKSDLFVPNKRSLALILQFAAAYYVEKKLSLSSLSEIILN